MLNFAKLFGKSPFAPLQSHMQKVGKCVDELTFLYEALAKNDSNAILECKKVISKLEHEADLTKNDIRNHLPKSIFLPIDRFQLLEILALQDALSDKAEDLAITATLAPLKSFSQYEKEVKVLFDKNIEAFHGVKKVIEEMDRLLETSFGGLEGQKVKTMIEEIAYLEHEIDLLQYDFVKKIYTEAEALSKAEFHLWITLVRELGEISNLSEKLANRIRMILEVK